MSIRFVGSTAAAGILAETCCVVAAAADPSVDYPPGGGAVAGIAIYLGVRLLKWSEQHQGRIDGEGTP